MTRTKSTWINNDNNNDNIDIDIRHKHFELDGNREAADATLIE